MLLYVAGRTASLTQCVLQAFELYKEAAQQELSEAQVCVVELTFLNGTPVPAWTQCHKSHVALPRLLWAFAMRTAIRALPIQPRQSSTSRRRLNKGTLKDSTGLRSNTSG